MTQVYAAIFLGPDIPFILRQEWD